MMKISSVFKVSIFFSLLFVLAVSSASAQYFGFGKNRVQYEDFEWRYLQSNHFDIYYYSAKNYDLAEFTAQYLEASIAQLSEDLSHDINDRIRVIIYDSHNDFSQTNVVALPNSSEGIGGVTEKYKNRMVIPFQGDFAEFGTTLQHELLHAVFNDLFYGGSVQSIISNNIQLRIPLWFEEGLAEYLSNGWDTNTDMFIRDAVINNYLPPIERMNGYLAYRGGQAMWNYIVEEYGRAKITEIIERVKSTRSVEAAFQGAFGMSIPEFSEQFHNALKKRYLPEVGERQALSEVGELITKRGQFGTYNTSPAISPAGERLAMISNETSGAFDVVVLSTINGKKLKTLIRGTNNDGFEELNILEPNLTWSPDGRYIALSTKSKGSDDLAIVEYETGNIQRIRFPNLDAIGSVTWAPNGKLIAFDGNIGSYQDIFVYNLETKEFSNITNDIFSDSEPTWSADSKKVYFSSNRGEFVELNAYQNLFDQFLNKSFFQKDIYAVYPGQSKAERITKTENVEETRPQALKNGNLLYISDENGIPNVYMLEMQSRVSSPMTNFQTGIQQLSASLDGSRFAISGYNEGYVDIFMVKSPLLDKREEPLDKSYWALRREKESDAKRVPAMGALFSDANEKRVREEQAKLNIEQEVVEVEEKEEEPVEAETDLDFRNYVFSEEVLEDSVIIAMNVDVFNPRENRNEKGELIPRKYRLSFSPDITYANAGLSTFGSYGLAQFNFSDLLGDHQISFATNLQLDLRDSDYVLNYTYLKNRWNYSVQYFHTARSFQTFYGDLLYRVRNYGGSFIMQYPFDKFSRIDFNLSYIGYSIDQADALLGSAPTNEKNAFIYPSVTYTKDNTTMGFITPVRGSRYSVQLSTSPDLFGLNPISFGSLLGDYRKYIDLGYTYSLAFRASGGWSFGKDPQSFFMGGVTNWINYRWANNNIPYERLASTYFSLPALPMRGYDYNTLLGNKFGLLNAEFRFPLVAALLPGPIPLLALYNLTGAAFVDVGTSWGYPRDYSVTLQSVNQNTGQVTNAELNYASVGKDFDGSLYQPKDAYIRYNSRTLQYEVVDNPDDFTLPSPQISQDGNYLNDWRDIREEYSEGSILVGAGFGLRTILLGFPVRYDIGWPYTPDGFGKRVHYFSIGIDF